MYAFQMQTMSWSRLRDMPITTVTQRLSEIFGGTEDGRVLRLFDGTSDSKKYDGTGAEHIRAKLTPAFHYCGAPDIQKQALMVRPMFLSGGTLSYTVLMNMDFQVSTRSLPPIETNPVGSLWDAATWDKDYWTPPITSHYEWRAVEGLGYSMTPTLNVSTRSRTVLTALEYMYIPGGPL
jgi:hypothetical protein